MKPTSESLNSLYERQAAILATLAVNPASYLDVSEALLPEMFPAGAMRDAAAHIWGCQSKGLGYDTASIRAACGEAGQAFNALLPFATSRNVLPGHAQAVREGWIALQSAEAMRRYIAQAQGPDALDALNIALQEIDLIKQATAGGKDRRSELFRACLDDIYNAGGKGFSGVPTPWQGLNQFTAGWQPGELSYIAARPGMGKTTVMCEYALAAAFDGQRVAFFSMGDMTAKQLYMKLASMLSGVPYAEIRTGAMDVVKSKLFTEALEQAHDLPIYAYDLKDVPNKIGRICDKIRLERERHECSLAIVDYVQQLRPDGNRHNSRNSEIEEISQALKHTAVLMDMPVVAGSQLSRAVETRGGGKRPQMSDLRDSGALEQDADHIQMLYRPAYYGINEDEEGRSTIGLTEIEIVKDRMAGEKIPLLFKARMSGGRLQEEGADMTQFPASAPSPSALPAIEPRRGDDDDVPF